MSDSGRERQDSGNSGDSGESRSTGREKHEGTSPWEWGIAAVSALLVLGAIGFMLHEALTRPDTPPSITVETDTIVETGRGFVVEFLVRNSGHTTAQGLTLQGELKSDTGIVERAEVTIDYVPSESTRRGGLFFSHDPRRYTLEIRPRGYDRP